MVLPRIEKPQQNKINEPVTRNLTPTRSPIAPPETIEASDGVGSANVLETTHNQAATTAQPVDNSGEPVDNSPKEALKIDDFMDEPAKKTTKSKYRPAKHIKHSKKRWFAVRTVEFVYTSKKDFISRLANHPEQSKLRILHAFEKEIKTKNAIYF